jgi:hypothetical protein
MFELLRRAWGSGTCSTQGRKRKWIQKYSRKTGKETNIWESQVYRLILKICEKNWTYYLIYDWPWLRYLVNLIDCCSVNHFWPLIIQGRSCTRYLNIWTRSAHTDTFRLCNTVYGDGLQKLLKFIQNSYMAKVKLPRTQLIRHQAVKTYGVWRHYLKVSGQLHAPAALPPGKQSTVPTV